ncbi:MAG: DUF423 domain-containing protein [Chitinophagaceae bacterium]
MYRPFLTAGAFLGGLGVALGAFGAHGLQKITQDETVLHGFQTAVQYQIYHALALLAVALIHDRLPHRYIRWAGSCFITGIILFSGSLYLLTFLKIRESGIINVVGPVTPLGGVFFIAGWLLLWIGAMGKKSS